MGMQEPKTNDEIRTEIGCYRCTGCNASCHLTCDAYIKQNKEVENNG